MSEQESTLDDFASNSDNKSNQIIKKKLKNLIEKDEAGVWGDEAKGSGVRVLRATNFNKNKIDLSDVAIRNVPDSKRGTKQLESGDIIVERSGGSPNQPVGRVLFFDLEGEYYHGNFLRQLRPKTSETNSRYLYYYLDYDYKRGGTKPLQTNTTNIRNLQYSSYLNQDIPVPSLSEQRKIATVIDNVDQAIQKTEALIQQTKQVKKGLLQDLFVNGIGNENLKEVSVGPANYKIPQSWILKKIGDISEVTSSTRIYKEDYVDEGIPYYRSTEIIRKSKGMNIEKPYYISERKFSELNKKTGYPNKGDILITSVGTLGVPHLVDEEEFYFEDGNIQWIKSPDINSQFLRYFMETEIFQSQVSRRTAGSSHKVLTIGNLKDLTLFCPGESEQADISNKVEQIEKFRHNNREYLEHLEHFKYGLMQDLLSGTVRTIDTNIQVPDKVAQHG